jgi:hypothetical protein
LLSSHNDIEFERGGMGFTAHVPDAVELKIELEVESDERELDIELTWCHRPSPGRVHQPCCSRPGTPRNAMPSARVTTTSAPLPGGGRADSLRGSDPCSLTALARR